jgi:hypothetical protein
VGRADAAHGCFEAHAFLAHEVVDDNGHGTRHTTGAVHQDTGRWAGVKSRCNVKERASACSRDVRYLRVGYPTLVVLELACTTHRNHRSEAHIFLPHKPQWLCSVMLQISTSHHARTVEGRTSVARHVYNMRRSEGMHQGPILCLCPRANVQASLDDLQSVRVWSKPVECRMRYFGRTGESPAKWSPTLFPGMCTPGTRIILAQILRPPAPTRI